MSVHLVLYSNGEVFDFTKKLTIETINNFTSRNVIIHDYNLEKIKQLEWFHNIKDLPDYLYVEGTRDGYCNSWKPFIVKEVYDKMNEDDILYYVDCSKYFKIGFTENIDKLCEIVNEKKFIAGSVGDDTLNSFIVKNYDFELSVVWNKVLQNNDNSKLLDKKHVLNSWFILKKNDINTNFLNEWIYWCMFKDDKLPLQVPLIIFNHTSDQYIFNMLVHKYKLLVFYKKNISHDDNKNKNRVLEVINNNENTDQYFIYL